MVKGISHANEAVVNLTWFSLVAIKIIKPLSVYGFIRAITVITAVDNGSILCYVENLPIIFNWYVIHDNLAKVYSSILQFSSAASNSSIYPNKPVQNFASKFPCFFHLKVKSAMSPLISLSTVPKKPV